MATTFIDTRIDEKVCVYNKKVDDRYQSLGQLSPKRFVVNTCTFSEIRQGDERSGSLELLAFLFWALSSK
jgi:hypothetical protein